MYYHLFWPSTAFNTGSNIMTPQATESDLYISLTFLSDALLSWFQELEHRRRESEEEDLSKLVADLQKRMEQTEVWLCAYL